MDIERGLLRYPPPRQNVYDAFYAPPPVAPPPPPLPPPPSVPPPCPHPSPAFTGARRYQPHFAYPIAPAYAGDCPHTCTHHSRKHKYRRRSVRRQSHLGGLIAWLNNLFSCLCCGCSHPDDEIPWALSPAEQRLAYLQRTRDMKCGQFSPRFLAETRAARKQSRLNLDALVKDTNNGILSSQSLESLELELLERSVKKRGRRAPLYTSWSTSQPMLYYDSNAHNSELVIYRPKKRSKSTPSLSAEQ